MSEQEPHRTGRIFPPNSPKPPTFIRAMRNTYTGELYHRDDFECWTRTGDQAVFIWKSLNHHDPHGRWVGVELQEVVEFTRTSDVFEDMREHFEALDADLTHAQELRLLDSPIHAIASLAEAQRLLRMTARELGVPGVA